jgi:hypothetical protein
MKQFIGCDMHKRFSVLVTIDEHGKMDKPVKVVNDALELRPYLATLRAGTPVAVEASRGGIGSSMNWRPRDSTSVWSIRSKPRSGSGTQ